jgi:glycosyltransferase involved in cell wall biosynthesis
MTLLDVAVWSTATAAFGGTLLARRHFARLPRLPEPSTDLELPGVCLCMPARDEALEIGPALSSWVAQEYPSLRILVVDDGSTDGTAAILDRLATQHPDRLRVIRNDHLPPGWLGKNHALDRAVREPEAMAAEWLLFVDADVRADPMLLRRVFAFLEAHPTDLLALFFGVDTQGFWEALVLPIVLGGSFLLLPVHQVPNPRHPAFCGVGAFTLVRRSAYDAVGGHAADPLQAIDDMMLARRVKRAGFINRVALGGPLLHLRLYHGLGEMLRGFRKNAAFHAGWWLMPFLVGIVLAVYLAPLWLPFAGHPWLAFLLWLTIPALVGDLHQRISGAPMDARWVFWPLIGPVVGLAAMWAFWDRLRGVNHWRGRTVRV